MTKQLGRSQPIPLQREGNDAEIIPFRPREEGESIDPEEYSLSGCVSFFIHKWNHPGLASRPIAEAINGDAGGSSDDDAWQKRLQEAVTNSPLFDYYDEILEADPITRLLDALMRSTQSNHGRLSEERKAMTTLMYMRGTEVIEEPGLAVAKQLKKLPVGDETLWENIIERLAAER